MSLLGGLGLAAEVGGAFLNYKSNKKAAKENAANNAWSRDFAERQFRTGIQTRVADAKAAGVHPLYAIGAGGGGGGSPILNATTGSAPGDAMQALGRGLRNQPNATQSALEVATLRKINAEADLIESQARASATAVASQAAVAQPTAADPTMGSANILPAEVTATNPRDPALKAGPAEPGMMTVRTAAGPLRVPTNVYDSEITAPIIWGYDLYGRKIKMPLSAIAKDLGNKQAARYRRNLRQRLSGESNATRRRRNRNRRSN